MTSGYNKTYNNNYYKPTTTDEEEDSSYLTLSERIARLSTSRVNKIGTSSSWQQNNLSLDDQQQSQPFTYLNRKNGHGNEIIYAQVVVDPNNEKYFDKNKYTVHRAYHNHNEDKVERDGRKRSNNNVTRVLLNSDIEEPSFGEPEPTSFYATTSKKAQLRVNDFYQPEKYFYHDDDLNDVPHLPVNGSFYDSKRKSQQLGTVGSSSNANNIKNKSTPMAATNNKKNFFSTLNKFFTGTKNDKNRKSYQSYEDIVDVEQEKQYFNNPTITGLDDEFENREKEKRKVKRRWTMREGNNKEEPSKPKVTPLTHQHQTLDNRKSKNVQSAGYNTMDNRHKNSYNDSKFLSVPRYYKKGAVSSAESDLSTNMMRSPSFLEKPKSRRSVYLHDQTVIDQIPKMTQQQKENSSSRRTVSKDDVSLNHSGRAGSINESSRRELSRSMSVVAPWGPNYYNNRKEYNYPSSSTTLQSARPHSRSPRPPSGHNVGTVSRKTRKPIVVSSSIESLIQQENNRKNHLIKRSKSFQANKQAAAKTNKFTNWFKRK